MTRSLWAIILAGGDGTRLQPLTRLITGAPIPKQYCRITGKRSLLEETLARVDSVVPRARTMTIVNRDHLPLAMSQLRSLPATNVVVQPRNRDTGPGVLLPVLEVARRDPDATVALFPSDHYVEDVGAFRAHVARAVDLVATDPAKLVLLGTDPEWADPGYGYILPGAAVPTADEAFEVRAFSEKPVPAIAARIIEEGALWNCFVVVCRAARLLELARRIRGADVVTLAAAAADPRALATAYQSLRAWNVSSDLLARVTAHLLVVRAHGIGWSDWGTVGAIERTLLAIGRTPPWRTPHVEASVGC